MEIKGYTNIFFIQNINIIGGVESFMFYLSKKYYDRSILIVYLTGDVEQIKRIRRYVPIRQMKEGDRFKCTRAYFQYGTFGIDSVEAEDYIFVVHADYKRQGFSYTKHPKITRHFAVSKTAQKGFKEAFGIDCELMYNPIIIDEPKKVLRLISATRLTPEKGYDRMKKLAMMFRKYNIPYLWDVYTYSTVDEGYFSKQKPRLDIVDYIQCYDYLVQLSDSEAYCYSVREALVSGVPCLVTDLPTFDEIGVKNGQTGYKLPLDMDIDKEFLMKIYDGLPKMPYQDVKDKWGSVLGKAKSKYDRDQFREVKVKARVTYYDVELKREVNRGEEYTTTFERAMFLQDKNVVEVKE